MSEEPVILPKVSMKAESAVVSSLDTLDKIAQELESDGVKTEPAITINEQVASELIKSDPVVDSAPKQILDESKIIKLAEGELPQLKKHVGKTFDPTVIQKALENTDSEGGIYQNRTTGVMKSLGPVEDEGFQIKPNKNNDKDIIEGVYEVTGFTVEFKPDAESQRTVSVNVKNNFEDLETATACILGNKYLMPIPGKGYKISIITSGAPTISHNGVMLYQYVNDSWRRV